MFPNKIIQFKKNTNELLDHANKNGPIVNPIAMAMIFSWVVYCSFVEKKVDNHSGGLCSFAINKSNSCFRVKNPSLWNAAFIQDL